MGDLFFCLSDKPAMIPSSQSGSATLDNCPLLGTGEKTLKDRCF